MTVTEGSQWRERIFYKLGSDSRAMAKTLTAYMERKRAEHELLTARQTLTNLVELYDSGRWRKHYRDDVFVGAVRKAREAVDHWTEVLDGLGDG